MRFVWLCLTLACSVGPDDPADKAIRAEMERMQVPGVAVAVVRDGQPIRIGCYGKANLEHEVPVKPETVFQTGSTGKQFTATLVMKLRDAGKLALGEPITKYLPEGRGKWDGVTIEHLLTHTSGLGDMPYDHMNMRQDHSEDELVKLMVAQPVREKPGEAWRYNNGGYVLLGALVRRATGQFYGDLLRSLIFEPLGMSSARIISERDVVPHRAAGYQLKNGALENQDWVAPALNTTADGSLYLSLLDMVRWDAALYGDKVLARGSLAQMWTPAKLSSGATVEYGFGWKVREQSGLKVIEHNGQWQGFVSFISRVPEKKLTVIVFCNLASPAADKIGRALQQIYVPELR